MFCKNCGSQIPDGVKFCTNCGTAMVQTVAASTGPALPPQVAASAPQPVPAYSPAPATPQNATVASMPTNSQQSAAVKSTLSKSGVTALVLSLATFVAEMIAVSYMLVDGWFVPWTSDVMAWSDDWIFPYIPMYLSCLLTVVFGLISIYGKRTKHGLIGVIITVVNFTILLAGHIIAIEFW
jgi:hypothetical protein